MAMDQCIKASGKTAKKMAKEHLYPEVDCLGTVNGRKDRELDGLQITFCDPILLLILLSIIFIYLYDLAVKFKSIFILMW